MNVLVTGGAGFIGSHIVDMLIDRGDDVTVIDDLSSGNLQNLNSKAKFIKCDLRDDLSSIFVTKYDYVIHLAAQINLRYSLKEPVHDAMINVMGSLHLMEYVKKSQTRFIFISTGGAIYSPYETLPWCENSHVLPQSPYGMAKYTTENYLQLYARLYGLDFAILRLSNVYGPKQNSHGEAGVIAIFVERILKNEELVIFGDGSQTRDFIYVKDVVTACKLVIEQNLFGLFNVATNTETSVNEIVDILKLYTDKQFTINYKEPIPGELLKSRLNYRYLKNISGWSPEYNLETGIQETLKYFLRSK